MKKVMKNVYDTPVCKVLSVDTQRVICDSQSGTENVGVTPGTW